ncbi:MAG: signal peptidase II [Candidatus Fermentibacteraceae bacterium]|nr:signal peptidase II [Candidatus Fermentibacteraceae bacterium]
MTETRARSTGYLTAVAFLAADQLTKRMALGWLDLHHPVEFLGGLARFTLVWNRGAAFSLPWGGPMFLTVITAAAAVLVSVLIWRMADRPALFLVGMGAILGGALGNLLDRFIYGSVVDFIDVGIGSRRWPTFNLADIAITTGGILLVILYRRDPPRSPEKGSETDAGD